MANVIRPLSTHDLVDDPDERAEPRILVIDDEPANVLLLTGMLQRAGYGNLVATHDSGEAAALYAESRPDLVVVDLHMPAPDGFAVMDALGALTDDDDFVPVLVLTADSDREVRERALAGGAHDVLSKPFSYREVVLRIENLLHTRRMHTGLRKHNLLIAAELAAVRRTQRAGEDRRQVIIERVTRVFDGDGFGLAFQPVVDLFDGSVIGIEALSRFALSPEAPPDRWFAEAAEVGLGLQLELHAIESAVASRAALPDGVFLSVNASPDTLRSPALHDIAAALPPGLLVIELTEHEAIADYAELDAALRKLREHGVRLAIDDTGAGYASLRHILRLGPDIIKLDRDLIVDVGRDPARRALISALIHFADELSAEVIAEGIETADELLTLRNLGVRYGQGFLLARPAPLPYDVAPLPEDDAEG